MLEQQRTRGQGPSLTREEEDLLLLEIQMQNRPRAASHVSSEWDGNPPHFDADWAQHSNRSQSGLTHSSSTPSMLSGSDGAMSPRRHQGGLSPSSSNTYGATLGGYGQGGTSVLDRTFTRSYGFTGAASFRDNNYIRSVEKEKTKTRSHHDEETFWEDPNKSPSFRGKALPTIPNVRPPMPNDASQKASTASTASTSLHPDRAKGAYSPSGSERTVTPLPSVQPVSYAAWKIPPRAEPAPPPAEDKENARAPPSVHVEEAPNSEPLSDSVGTTSTLRQRPVDPQRGQRQSLLMGMSPAQAKRISVALLEIETHLRRSTVMDGTAWEDYGPREHDDDEEEMLDGDNGYDDDHHDDAHTHAHTPYGYEIERRPSGSSSTGGASSIFPFTASPASTNRAVFGSSQTDVSNRGQGVETSTPPPRIPSLPSLDVNAVGSPHSTIASPSSHVASPSNPLASTASRFTSPSQQSVSHFASPSSQTSPPWQSNRSDSAFRHASSHSIASTTYSEDDYSRPTLVPTKPQPARYTPSPAPGAPSAYVPGQPRPVGSMRQPSQSSQASTPTPPPNSQSPGQGQVDPLAKRLQYPAVPGAPTPSLARSLSEQQHSSANSRSQTPTQPPLTHVPAPGALASRHQASQSLSEPPGNTWRTGSSLAIHSPPSRSTINEEENNSHTRNRSVTDTPSIKSREPSPLLSKKKTRSPDTNSPSMNSLNSLNSGRTESVASVSSTWTGPMPMEESASPWDRLLNHTPALQEPPPCAEEESADLELLKSMSGMGKAELSIIQNRLVEKAKSERDRLRAEGETTPVHSPSTTHANLLLSTPPSYLTYLPSPDRGSPASLSGEPTSPLAAIAMLPGHIPGLPPAPVDPSELPLGPPPPRPAHPSESTTVQQRALADTPALLPSASQSPTKAAYHGRGDSKARVWIDDDPEAKRDIEKRIADATSSLFRAPSRTAHKRSLSKSAKKQISSPTLLTYSANVPTVPITVDDGSHKRNKSTEKGPTHKLSLRWKRKGKKSQDEPSLPPSSLPAAFATPSTAQTSANTTPASQTSMTKSVNSPTPAPRKKSDADLNGFRFPNASSTGVNGTGTGTISRPRGGSGASVVNTNPLSPQLLPAQPTPHQPAAPRAPTTVAHVMELSKKTHRPTGSEDSVAIAKFYESGRAVGLSESQLHDMLQKNATLNRSGTTTSTRSRGSTAPTSHGQSPQPPSPTVAVMHLGNGVKLQPPASLARIPTPVVEQNDASSVMSERASSDIAEIATTSPEPPAVKEPTVVHHTIVMADMPLPPQGMGRSATPPAQSSTLLQPERPDKSPKRSNSIRRKPVQITDEDRELITRSPMSGVSSIPAVNANYEASHNTTSNSNYDASHAASSSNYDAASLSNYAASSNYAPSHTRNPSNYSNTSETWALPPRQFLDGAYEGKPDSASSIRNSSTQGSIYDYYGESPAMSPTRSGFRGSGVGSVGRQSGYGYNHGQNRDSVGRQSGYGFAPPQNRDSQMAGGMERASQAVEIT